MNAARIKIIVWGIVALLLLLLLVFALNGSAFGLDISSVGFVTTYTYPDSETFKVGGAALPAKTNVHTIELDWLAGEIDICFYDGNEITFDETAPRELKDNELLRYLVKNDTLTIKYCATRTALNRYAKMTEKSIKVMIPKDIGLLNLSITNVSSSVYVDGAYVPLHQFKIDSVSGAIDVLALETRDMRIDTVSGRVTVDGGGTNVQVESVSGNVALHLSSAPKYVQVDSISGSVQVDVSEPLELPASSDTTIDMDVKTSTISGSIVLNLSSMPDKLNVSSISGSVQLKLPENKGFTAKLDTISGSLQCNLVDMINQKRIVYGDGNAQFTFDTVSGSVKIECNATQFEKPVPSATSAITEKVQQKEEKPAVTSTPVSNFSVPSSSRNF